MGKFILSYQGEGSRPEPDVARLRAADSVTILDDSLPRRLLVEAPEDVLRGLLAADWSIAPERTYRMPGPHPAATRLPRKARR